MAAGRIMALYTTLDDGVLLRHAEPMASRSPSPTAFPGERIAKVMARAGLCSRRDAERLIADGRVTLNGTVLTSPAINVGPGDAVLVDGRPLPDAERVRLWRYHKPAGLVVPTATRAAGQPSSTGCRRSCRGWSRSGGSTSTPKGCCC